MAINLVITINLVIPAQAGIHAPAEYGFPPARE